MRAVVVPRYGSPDVLDFREVPTPVPGPREVRVRVLATTVTAADWRVRSAEVPKGFGLFVPLALGIGGPRQKILGTELAGVVDAVGAEVKRFAVGDPVVAFPGGAMGAHAEFVCLPENGRIVPKPANLTFEEASSVLFGGTTALDYLGRGRVTSGTRVLVNGASGGVGTSVVQLAKHLGAHVVGVCSAKNAVFVTSLGADEVIDYASSDFAASGARYDVIVDAVGNVPMARAKAALTDDGRLLAVAGALPVLLAAPWVALTSRRRIIAGPASENPSTVAEVMRLAAEGRIKPVIEERFPFERIADAHRLVDSGRKRGAVVVTLDPRAAEA